ncbi:MAG: hypothetical protein FVQ83_12930 [Chloroflexi bacterium]|nr:hypothetical protein [Chloroflexota bacterium]
MERLKEQFVLILCGVFYCLKPGFSSFSIMLVKETKREKFSIKRNNNKAVLGYLLNENLPEAKAAPGGSHFVMQICNA